MDKKVAVILINYHDYANRFLSDCRDSLRSQTYSNFQVYIIDNDSSEETLSYLKTNYEEAIILPREDGNYSAANNLGFRTALEDGADYLVALNMDTEVEANFLVELVKALELNQQAGIAQAKILLHQKGKKENKLNSIGNIIHFLGFGFTDGYGKDDFQIDGYPEIKGYASGCAFIITKEAFTLVGGLNEEFYMYHDDVELSLKVKLAGYKIILASQARVWHKYEFERSVKMFYYMERNRYLTLIIFASKRYLALIALPLFFMDIAMFVFAVLNGRLKELLRVYAYFLKSQNLDKILAERKRLKKIQILKFSEVAHNFKARIEFQEIANPILKYIANPLMAAYWLLIKKII